MIALQTIVPNPATALRLSQQRPVLLVGSCFTEHIARRLADSGFEVQANPFGILYNPISIAECLRRCYSGEEITPDDLVCHNGLWHSWLHHGSFSCSSQDECLRLCNEALSRTHQFLQLCPQIIVTLGTAYVYEHQGRVVANCHKLPADAFIKRLLSVDEVRSAFAGLPIESIIFTVSPIRHWADTPHGNQLSKSTLLLATQGCEYFPAYEIVMDELRDYRFYESDMLHPSAVAVEIIWERFCATYFAESVAQLALKYQKLHKMQAHRPLFPDSPDYQNHLAKIRSLQSELDKSKINLNL